MPHMKGRIKVEYRQVRKGLQTDITLPEGMNGTFEHNGEIRELREGINSFTM